MLSHFLQKKTNTKFLAISLGFSAGVMIYVSMIEIFAKAKDSLVAELGLKAGSWAAVASFFAGMLLIAIIDNVLPNEENPHHLHNVEELNETKVHIEDNLMRTGIFTALAVGIHNFPEGLAAFISALQEPSIAIPITVAIAIHNIPEGISISAPIYYATGDRKKAFKYSFLSGLAEPIGALIGYLILMPFLNDLVFGIVFGVVAGIMVYISLDELLPSAQKYGDHHLSIGGLISGMAVMAVSLLLFI